MTREEQIKKQADIYTDDASNYTEWSDDGGWSVTNDIDLVEKAFIEGAKWADEHPKSPWISVEDDLPCNISKIIHFGFTNKVLVIDEYKNIFIAYMERNRSNEWIWRCDDNFSVLHTITHWKPIPYLQEE